jgi:hypothetical protein
MSSRAGLYDREFFRWHSDGSYRSATVMVPLVLDFLSVRSVCDVGCGVGAWLRCWRESGVEDILGIDGDYVERDQLMIPPTRFRSADLCQPIRCERNFDLAMSLEVAEHLPESRAASFVADLAMLAPVVLFSAAVPGQGGTNHINERWPDYWAVLFDRVGFATFDVLRPAVWVNDAVQFWYRQNTLLFCRRDAIESYSSLATVAATTPLALVHPMLLEAKTAPLTTTHALTALQTALRRAAARRIGRIWRSP